MQNNIWLITDTHFGHDKMVEYCGRPVDHSERILKNLAMVRPGDTLIHLGDFCIGNDENWARQFVQATPGVHRILVRGNHDRKSDNWYLNNGFDFVCQAFRNKYFGKNLLFTHIPQENIFETIDHNIHGHFHNADHRRTEPELQAIYDHVFHKLLAIEYTNLEPIKLEKFLAKNV